MRIWMDPQALNEALERKRHPLRVLDISPEVVKIKVFSKLDLRDGYSQYVLNEDSSLLTIFQTPVGCYWWRRFPVELTVSRKNFERRLQSALDWLNIVQCLADVILMFGVEKTRMKPVPIMMKSLKA